MLSGRWRPLWVECHDAFWNQIFESNIILNIQTLIWNTRKWARHFCYIGSGRIHTNKYIYIFCYNLNHNLWMQCSQTLLQRSGARLVIEPASFDVHLFQGHVSPCIHWPKPHHCANSDLFCFPGVAQMSSAVFSSSSVLLECSLSHSGVSSRLVFVINHHLWLSSLT